MQTFSKLLLLLTFFISNCTSQKTTPTKPKADIEVFLKSGYAKWNVSDSLAPLLPILDSIFLDDQRFRSAYDNRLFLKNFEQQRYLDSINTIKLKAIMAQYGWLSIKQIGFRTGLLMNTMQHIRPFSEREYFLNILLSGYAKGTLPTSGMFKYIDRYLTILKEQQLFGTELFEVGNRKADGVDDIYPIFQPEKLEERWKKYGSGIFTYTGFIKGTYSIKWDAKEHLQFVEENAKSLKVNLDSTTQIIRMLHLLDSCKALMGKNNTNLH